jgi:hypothetical protein
LVPSERRLLKWISASWHITERRCGCCRYAPDFLGSMSRRRACQWASACPLAGLEHRSGDLNTNADAFLPCDAIGTMLEKVLHQFCLHVSTCTVQARAVIDGLPADIAALALPLDVMKIADAGLMRQVCTAAHPHMLDQPARKWKAEGIETLANEVWTKHHSN